MADTNKIKYGIRNVTLFPATIAADGSATYGTAIPVPGAVSLSLDQQGETNKFYADNTVYWSGYSDNGLSGEIENALFDDTFKTTFMNYVALTGGGIAQIKGQQNKPVYIVFQSKGDQEARRMIMYNVALGQITREYATTEDTVEPATATLPYTVNGDSGTGITRVSYAPDDADYDNLFTTPPVPALP